MESPEQFIRYEPWTADEKKVARRAFNEALGRHLSAIIAEAKRRMANVVDPSDLWEVETYFTESRKTIDRIYQYRYSDLLRVFSILMRDGWLKEADLVGLQPDKIAEVKAAQRLYAEIFRTSNKTSFF
jgi:Photoprotection regulator fluorescence recovery protein